VRLSRSVLRNQPLGNVRNRPFSEIWTDEKNELLMKLKDKKKHVHGRCAGCCGNVCGGNFAPERIAGELWGLIRLLFNG